MDPVSHAVLGAAVAEPASRGKQVLAGVAIGAIASLAPDADVLIRSTADPLLALEYHRHFTHSLVFAPVGTLLCAALLFPLFRRWVELRACVLFCFLGYSSHALLDACTSYGTELLWPFARERVAFDVVSAVDPLFTVPLLGLVLFGVLRRRPGFAVAGLAWGVAYLGFGWVQQTRAMHAALDLAASRGHAPTHVEVKPSFGNTLLWRTIYEADGNYHIDAARVVFAAKTIAGTTRTKLDLSRDFPWLQPGTQQWRDVERLSRIASGYLALDDQNRTRIVDIRYSLVPNRADAWWGIELDTRAGPEAHASYVTMRLRSTAEGRDLLRMLLQGDTTE